MGHQEESLTFVLRPVPPFRLDLTVWALRRRRRNLVDRWDGTTYRRVVVVGGRPTELAVRQAGSSAAPKLSVTATPSPRTRLDRRHVAANLDRLLGLRNDLTDWYRMAADDERLRPLADRFRGMKPPRFPTMFEAVINAFACQQLSLEVGLELLNRLAAIAGAAFRRPQDIHYAFPTAQDVLRLTPAEVPGDRVQPSKGPRTSRPGRRDCQRSSGSRSPRQGNDAAVQQGLLELRGVGRWTAEYVLLRGLGRFHVFPGDDVGAQKRLGRWLGRSRPMDYAGVQRAVKRWRPYAGLVYLHLLLDGLSQAGALDSTPGPDDGQCVAIG